MNNCPFVRNQELIAISMEELIPDLKVIGVDKSTDIVPKDIAISETLRKDMKDLDFQVLQSRFLALGDILDEEENVVTSNTGKPNYEPKVDDGLEYFVDTETVDSKDLERRLEARRLDAT